MTVRLREKGHPVRWGQPAPKPPCPIRHPDGSFCVGNRQSGLTLIEVLIAMLILAGAFTVLGSAWSGSLLALRKSRLNTTVSTLLQKKTTEMEIKYKEAPNTLTDEGEDGDFGADFKEFRWEMKSRKLEMPDITDLLTERDGGASEMEITMFKTFMETLTESVREMKVTVIYKALNGREVQYAVATYIVDHSKFQAAAAAGAAGAGGSGGGNDKKQ